MTMIENRVDDALFDMKHLRGSLLATKNSLGDYAQDYSGLCGQLNVIQVLTKEHLEQLEGIIKTLEEVAPEQKEDE